MGVYIDDEDFNTHGFVLSAGAYTSLDAPGADGGTIGQGVNNRGDVVGYYTDAFGNDHGFVLSGGVYTTVDVPGAVWTDIYSITSNGETVGAYEDADGVHGYVATPR